MRDADDEMKDRRGTKCSIWCACALVVLLALCVPHTLGARQGARILLINSYHDGFKWSDDIVSGVRSVLGKDDDLRIEYMDARRISTPEYLRSLRESFRIKFRGHRYDVVIVSDDPALDLILDLGEDLFPSTPVVFCGINDFSDARLMGKTPYTGVVEEIDIKDTLDAAHCIRRQEDVPVNSNVTESQQAPAGGHDPRPAGVFEFEMEDPELGPFLERLKGCGDEHVILAGVRSSAARDTNRDGTPEIAKEGICYSSYYLGHGIVAECSPTVSTREDGYEIARRILGGEKDIPVVRRAPISLPSISGSLALGIEEDLLLRGVVVNKPVSFYARHADAVHAGAGIILFASLPCLPVDPCGQENRAEREPRRYQDNLRYWWRKGPRG